MVYPLISEDNFHLSFPRSLKDYGLKGYGELYWTIMFLSQLRQFLLPVAIRILFYEPKKKDIP